MAQRFERHPAYVADRHAAVSAVGLHYIFAVCCAVMFAAVSSLVDAGAAPTRPPAPQVAANSDVSADFSGMLACQRGSNRPSS